MPVTDIITPQWLKDNYLVGITLTDDQDNPYPDTHYYQSIDAAVSGAEGKYDISLRQSAQYTYRENYDGMDWDFRSWHLNITHKRPLLEIVKFEVGFGGFAPYELPTSWIHITSERAGQIQILPDANGFPFPGMRGSMPAVAMIGLTSYRYVPKWYRVQYKAGFEQDMPGTVSATAGGTEVTYTPTGPDDDFIIERVKVGGYVKVGDEVHRVSSVTSRTAFKTTTAIATTWSNESCVNLGYDPSLLEAIGLMAALPLLDTAGDLIIGAGISNISLSMDGLSQSVGTTAGVENSGYGARASQYRKRIEELDKNILRNYRAIPVAVI